MEELETYQLQLLLSLLNVSLSMKEHLSKPLRRYFDDYFKHGDISSKKGGNG